MIYSISDLVPSCGAISDHLNARLAVVGGGGSWPAGLPPCRATIDDAAPAAVGSLLHYFTGINLLLLHACAVRGIIVSSSM